MNFTDENNLKQGYWRHQNPIDDKGNTSIGHYVDDIKEGTWLHLRGTHLVSIRHYKNGVKHGWEEMWLTEGLNIPILNHRFYYNNGVKEGLFVTAGDAGTYVNGELNGYHVSYEFPYGKILEEVFYL